MADVVTIQTSRGPFTVSRQHADRFKAFLDDPEWGDYQFDPKQSGGYNPRNIRGTNIPSQHSFGSAIDINWTRNARGTPGDIDPTLARTLAKRHGLTWGGDWSNPDPMHFEVSRSGPVPIAQRGIANFAGVPKPTTDPAAPAADPPSPRMALGGPKPMPYDANGKYTPQRNIDHEFDLARMLMGTPAVGPVDGFFLGLGGGARGKSAKDMTQRNQDFEQEITRGAFDASSPLLAAEALSRGSPEQRKLALSLMLQEKDQNRALERQAKELELKERMMRIQGAQDLFGGGAPSASAGQPPPPAASAAPALPSGLPGVTTVGGMPIPTPGFTPGQPTPSPVVGMPTPSARPEMSPQEKIRQLPKEKQFALRDAYLTKNPKFYEMLDEALDPGKKGRESYDTEFAKSTVKDFDEIKDAGRKGLARVGDLDVIESLIKNPSVLQGPGAERFSIPMRRTAEFFGIKTEGLPPTQLFQALVNKMALEARNPSGGAGMPGAMSDPDREFLRTMVPGLQNTPEGNAALIAIHKRVAQRDIEISRMAINYAKSNGGRMDLGFYDALHRWSAANPMWSDKQKAALAGNAQPSAAPGSPAAGAAPAPAPAQETPAKSKQQLDAAPVGTIEAFSEGDQVVRRKKRPDGKWERVSTGEEASLAMKGIGEDIAKSPAAKFLKWLQSQAGTSANAAEPPIEGAP
jgi:hypothetical protein